MSMIRISNVNLLLAKARALHRPIQISTFHTVTPDERCSFTHFECLGSCDTAPMMMVDDRYHENLTPEKVREIVRGLD